MLAAWYDRQGPAAEVLQVGELPAPEPGPGEVRVRVRLSGINPGDTKKRVGWQGTPMSFPRIIPHSDGAGVIDAVRDGRRRQPDRATGVDLWRPVLPAFRHRSAVDLCAAATSGSAFWTKSPTRSALVLAFRASRRIGPFSATGRSRARRSWCMGC